MKKYKNKSKIIIAVIVLIIAGGFIGWKYFVDKNTQEVTNTADTTTDSINYDPPTEEEQLSGNTQKNQSIKDEDNRNNTTNQSNNTATVIITDAGQYDDIIEVRSFISDHYEDGTCTITFSQGTNKVQKSTPAYRDASTTICTNPLFPRSDFPSGGDWDLSVSYEAGNTKGTSETKTIKIN